ncbi:MAG: 3-phosphoshikimate 1-carboxyvinyltransferase [Phycisphaerae bacterium]|nr:3-phosphoshikimate 1-carboxyvinyltransferase [Phycisphaerae bacterium]
MPLQWIDGDVFIKPVNRLRAVVRPPGSKSLTNRYLTCAALADGVSRLQNAAPADDVARMAAVLTGVGIENTREFRTNTLTVRGAAGQIPATEAALDIHHAGTAMRFATALLSTGHGEYRLDGSERMRQRPIGQLVDVLRQLGARIEYTDNENCPPLIIHAAGLAGGTAHMARTPSSQFVSALLMVAPYAGQDVMLELDEPPPSRPYVDMTIEVMRSMGVEVVEDQGTRFIVAASQRYRGGNYEIEPDASGATYFWAAAAATGGRVRVSGLSRSSRQGDAAFVDVLEAMGCQVVSGRDFIEVAGPDDRSLRGVNVDLNAMPDTVQTLAVLALFASDKTEIRNVANLRLKETDRLNALASELARLGARVDVHRDGLTIFPPEELNPAEIETYDDHRMAMSFSIAALMTKGVVIKNGACVDKSFPGYFDVLTDAVRQSRNGSL